MLSVAFGDERAEHGLAFVEGEEVFCDLCGGFVEGGGLDEEVENCGQDLGGEDGGVDFDLGEFGVGEEEGNVEIADMGVVVGCYAAVVWK